MLSRPHRAPRRRHGFLLLLLAALAASAPASAVDRAARAGPGGSTRRTSTVKPPYRAAPAVGVPGMAAVGVDTGRLLHFDETLTLRAQGTITLEAGGPAVGPDGTATACGSWCPSPTSPRGVLLAQIRESVRYFDCTFPVGAAYDGPVRCQGRLFLIVNDNSFADNSGAFEATFEIGPTTSGCLGTCVSGLQPGLQSCIDACAGSACARACCVAACKGTMLQALATCAATNCARDGTPFTCMATCNTGYAACLRGSAVPPLPPECTSWTSCRQTYGTCARNCAAAADEPFP